MKATAIETRYASMKSVKKFFGTKETAIQFPADFDLTNSDEKLFVQACRKLQNAEPNKNGERIVKPIFSFGRVLVKMSKNADNFALAQCTIYLTEYEYGDEKRVQVVIAPPSDNSEFDDIDVDDLSFIGSKPQIADDDEDDENDDTADDDEDDDEPAPAPKKKGGKK